MQNEYPQIYLVFGQSKNCGGAESAPFGIWAYKLFLIIQIMHIRSQMKADIIWDPICMIWMTKK